MPAGDLIARDYQFELRGLLHGAGTFFDNAPPGWGGLGIPTPKTADVELDQAPGAYGSRDYQGVRTLTFPLTWNGGDDGAAGCMDLFLALSEAWAPSVVDLELYFRLPGWGLAYVTGRPRGLVEDLSRLKSGEGAALATFVALDPTITFADGSGS